jgi:hypothetical protein
MHEAPKEGIFLFFEGLLGQSVIVHFTGDAHEAVEGILLEVDEKMNFLIQPLGSSTMQFISAEKVKFVSLAENSPSLASIVRKREKNREYARKRYSTYFKK